MSAQLRISRAFGLAAALLSVAAGAQRAAADYLLTATGNFDSSSTESYAFDGMTSVDGHLPSLYDTARLQGGSFVATYRFSTMTPPASGSIANYDFSSPAGLSYVLLDPDGAVIHVGTNPSVPFASVFNNVDGFVPGTTYDQVSLYAFVNDVSGLVTPPALYQSAADLFASSSVFLFRGDVTAGSDFIPSLAVPTDAAAYLGFSSKNFVTAMTFNDGDTLDFIDPYQYVESRLRYLITNVTVTAVPEPSSLTLSIMLFFLAAAVLYSRPHGCSPQVSKLSTK